MGRVCVFLLAILPIAVAAVPAAPVRGAEPAPAPPPLKIGMPESMFNGLPPAVVQVGSQPFKEMFEKQTGLKGEVALMKDYSDAAAQLRDGKIDVAVFHGFEYAWVKNRPELVPLMATVPSAKLQACLVVNANSKATSPSDLKGMCVAVPNATKAHCHLYFDRLKEKLPADRCGTAKLASPSIEDALDAVAGGNCEAMLVDTATLDGYRKNKPGVGEQLKVLDQSEVFPSAVIIYRKDVFDAKTAEKVRTGLTKGIETPQGQLLKGMWKLKGFSEAGQAYLTELDKSVKCYPAPKQK